MKIKIVKLDAKYCDYLRTFDSRVPYNKQNKELRPFIGILFVVNNCEYFSPLSSPKPKHINMKDYIDFIKIKNGNLGVINFNNMLPVTKENYTIIDLDNDEYLLKDKKYQKLLKEQFKWINVHFKEIQNKARKLYKLYTDGNLNKKVMDRCCNFALLEEKCSEYKKEKISI